MSNDTKKDDVSAKDNAYFGYYRQYVHQQNMLQDIIRTSAYRDAIFANGPNLFENKVVMDVGAGSGILSYFAVQAGAKQVVAVEASDMAGRIQKMVNAAGKDRNPWLVGKVKVVNAKMEDENLDIPPIDTIISEPIGVLLVHERMIESFLYARDKYLKKGLGRMMPDTGTIYLAPFTDANLWTQTMSKARFWESKDFYGVDFSALALDAKDEIFGQPVVGCFDPHIIMGSSSSYMVDFESVTMENLKEFTIPIDWRVSYTGLMHGIAGWFDISLCGHILSTSPSAGKTHWQQVRFLLKEPLAVNAGQSVQGSMHLVVNPQRSYTVTCTLRIADVPEPFGVRKGTWALHEQTYWYQSDGAAAVDFKPEYHCLYEPDHGDVEARLNMQSHESIDVAAIEDAEMRT